MTAVLGAPGPTRAGPGLRARPAGLTLVEVALAVGLLALVVGQMLGYPATDDSDPDGYLTYARHLLETGTLLPESRRRSAWRG